MKYFSICLLFFVMALSGFSQEHSSIYFSTGYDHNINYLSGLKYDNTNKFPDFNFGFGGTVYLNDRFRLRGELKYVNLSYTRNYDPTSSTSNTLDHAKISINYLDLNPYLDYRFFSIGKLDFYGYAGLCLEFSMGDHQRVHTVGGDTSTKKYIDTNYKKELYGVTGGCIFSYNLDKHFALTLSPEYTYFVRYLYFDNSSNLQRINVNVGFEYKF
jgi:hypothetical protein